MEPYAKAKYFRRDDNRSLVLTFNDPWCLTILLRLNLDPAIDGG